LCFFEGTKSCNSFIRATAATLVNDQYIVLGVKKSGCSGFMYDLKLKAELEGNEKAFSVADDVTLYVTSEALAYVNGTEIDYTTEGLNSSMVFKNPNAKDQCGCGESFSI